MKVSGRASMRCHICSKELGDSFYTYELENGFIDLCDDCERELLVEMVAQFILETKMQVFPEIWSKIYKKEKK